MKGSLPILLLLLVTVMAIYFFRPPTELPAIDTAGAPVMEYRVAWAFDPPTRSAAPGGALWVGQRIVMVPLACDLACFDSESGARKWPLPEAGPPALEPQLLKLSAPGRTQLLAFISTGGGFVRVVDADTARVVWSARLGSPVVGPPSQAGQYRFAATRDGQLFQRNERTGAGVGRFNAAALLGGNPTVLPLTPARRPC